VIRNRRLVFEYFSDAGDVRIYIVQHSCENTGWHDKDQSNQHLISQRRAECEPRKPSLVLRYQYTCASMSYMIT
jgi:hypothetical protein